MSETKTQNNAAIEVGMRKATTNLEYVKKFDELNSTQISKLFWIAASLENLCDLEDFLQDMSDDVWNKLFPSFGSAENDYFDEYREGQELIQLLIENDTFGFLAEIDLPYCDKFMYDGDKLISWSLRLGSRLNKYVYAETIEELYAAIEKESEEAFEYFKTLDSRKNKPEVQPQN